MESLALPAPSARIITLANGLELIIEEDHSAPVASVQAWVKTGSIHEDRLLGAGVSHFLEHLLFKGTAKRGAQDFARSVQDQGGYINAYTSFDRTVYWIDIPAQGVASAVELLSDALMNSTLPAEELTKEQEVIRREFAMGFDDADSVAGKQMFSTAFVANPMRHPVIGHLESFNQLTREDLQTYYRTRYTPNNIFFVIAGDVDADAIHEQMATFFETHQRRVLPDVFHHSEPTQLGRREKHSEFATELTRLGIAWHVPGVTHPDLPALDILATVLGSGRSARMYRTLREELGLVHGVDAWCYTPSSSGLFGVDAMLDPERREAVEEKVMAMIEQSKQEGVTDAEIKKARRQFLSQQINALGTMRGKANDLGSNWLYARSLSFTQDYLGAIQRVSSEDIQRVASKYFTESNLIVSSLNPKGSLSNKRIRKAAPDRAEIVKFELSNGLRVLVREDDRLPLVSVTACFQGGLLVETAEKNGLSRLFAKTLPKGTAIRSAEQIADEIESVGGALGAESGNNSVGASVRVLRPDFDLGLELLGDMLCNATYPEKAIAREKEAMLASIKADDEEVTSAARNIMRAKIFGAHPYGLRSIGSPESVAGLGREDLLGLHQQVIGARNGVLAVFGAVRVEEIREQLEAVFGKIPKGAPAFANVPAVAPLNGNLEERQTMPKSQAVLMVGFPGADVFSEDRIALELIDEACSDLGSRLFNRIREQMGLAYFVGSSNLMGLARGAFTFYLGTDPAKLTEVRAALDDEISKLATDGLDAAELARAKQKILGAQAIRNQSNDAFAHSCALDELYGLGYDHYRTEIERVNAVTREQVRDVAQRYFTAARVTAIVSPD